MVNLWLRFDFGGVNRKRTYIEVLARAARNVTDAGEKKLEPEGFANARVPP